MSPRIALWAGVASLWIIVTLLKLQLQMFSANLFINVLGPTAAASQPPWLYALLSFVDRLWVQHLALANLTVFAVEAIKRRTALAWPRLAGGTHRPLALIAWGAVVWAVGGAFGSLLSGDARVMSEASGVSLVYVITGIVLLLPAKGWLDGRAQRWLRIGLGAFWLFGAFLQVQPDFWTGAGLAGVFGDVTLNGTQPPLHGADQRDGYHHVRARRVMERTFCHDHDRARCSLSAGEGRTRICDVRTSLDALPLGIPAGMRRDLGRHRDGPRHGCAARAVEVCRALLDAPKKRRTDHRLPRRIRLCFELTCGSHLSETQKPSGQRCDALRQTGTDGLGALCCWSREPTASRAQSSGEESESSAIKNACEPGAADGRNWGSCRRSSHGIASKWEEAGGSAAMDLFTEERYGDLRRLNPLILRERIRTALAAFQDVAGAFLFGSALDFVRSDSDIDLGLVMRHGLGSDAAEHLTGRVEAQLGRFGPHPFHVTLLRPEANSFAFRVLGNGELVYVADEARVTDVMEIVGREHDDLEPFRRTFYEALGMGFKMAIDIDRIRARLVYIREQIGILEPMARDVDRRRDRMLDPLSYSGIVRNLQTSVEAMIDIAFHLCAKLYAKEPQSAADAFEILADRGGLPLGFLPRARDMVRFRNLVLHGYRRTERELVERILAEDLGDFSVWEQVVSDIIERHGSPPVA